MFIKSEGFRERGGWWVVAQFALFALILIALTADRQADVEWRVAGWTITAVGALAVVSGLWVIRSELTAMPAPLDGGSLRQRGPYLLVRHPIYGGLILGFTGLAIGGANPLALVLSVALVPFFYAKTSVEERLLMARFPEYAEYRHRVRFRILPWIL